jgi:hypothetical protein
VERRFFATQAAFLPRLSRYHADSELWVGFHAHPSAGQTLRQFTPLDKRRP